MKEKPKKEVTKNMEEKPSKAAESSASSCKDRKCPFHGTLSARGRSFKGHVKKVYPKRAVIELELFLFIRKYERYEKRGTRIHAHVPDCLAEKVKEGSYVKVMECRPLSKIIHHVVTDIELEEGK